jgi:hypothetical protein
MATPIVEPIDANPTVPPVAPVESPAPGAEAPPSADQGAAAGLPDDLIRIPAIQALLVGEPPAVSASIEAFSKRPEGQIIAKNAPVLNEAGMGLYKSMSGDLGILFNQMYVTPQELQQADKEGKLAELAPPFDDVNKKMQGLGDKNPVLNKNFKPPTGFKQAGAPPIPPSTGQPPKLAAKPAPSKVVAPKLSAQNPGSPTSGPAPGAGRLMNSILKPVI